MEGSRESVSLPPFSLTAFTSSDKNLGIWTDWVSPHAADGVRRGGCKTREQMTLNVAWARLKRYRVSLSDTRRALCCVPLPTGCRRGHP